MLLRLDFRDEFKLEESPDCRFDYLEVRDGQHGYSNLLGNFCGTKFPPEITSKTRYLWLRFHSDDSIEDKGFKAIWSMIPRPTYRKCTVLRSSYSSVTVLEIFLPLSLSSLRASLDNLHLHLHASRLFPRHGQIDGKRRSDATDRFARMRVTRR